MSRNLGQLSIGLMASRVLAAAGSWGSVVVAVVVVVAVLYACVCVCYDCIWLKDPGVYKPCFPPVIPLSMSFLKKTCKHNTD
jgi:hypothetical protein